MFELRWYNILLVGEYNNCFCNGGLQDLFEILGMLCVYNIFGRITKQIDYVLFLKICFAIRPFRFKIVVSCYSVSDNIPTVSGTSTIIGQVQGDVHCNIHTGKES